jgi:hypothetical protein
LKSSKDSTKRVSFHHDLNTNQTQTEVVAPLSSKPKKVVRLDSAKTEEIRSRMQQEKAPAEKVGQISSMGPLEKVVDLSATMVEKPSLQRSSTVAQLAQKSKSLARTATSAGLAAMKSKVPLQAAEGGLVTLNLKL